MDYDVSFLLVVRNYKVVMAKSGLLHRIRQLIEAHTYLQYCESHLRQEIHSLVYRIDTYIILHPNLSICDITLANRICDQLFRLLSSVKTIDSLFFVHTALNRLCSRLKIDLERL